MAYDNENQETSSDVKITEALELLNEAAREKKDEIRGLLTEKYGHIKEAIFASSREGRKVIERTRELAHEALDEGEEKIREAVQEVDKRIRKNPWPYISGAAAFSLLIGYVMGVKHK